MAGVGHNSDAVAADQLKTILERIERLDEDRVAVVTDISEVYKEAKGNGFDSKALRKLVALRRKDPNTVKNDKAMLELYASAIGCLELV